MNGIDKYLNDNDFIKWIVEPNPELNAYWQDFILNHPEEKENLEGARKVVTKLGSISTPLSSHEKEALLSNILSEINHSKKPFNLRWLYTGLKYAAIIFIIFSVGILYTSRSKEGGGDFEEFAAQEVEFGSESKLVGVDGETIILKQDHSKLVYSDKGELILDEDASENAPPSKVEKALNQLLVPFGKTAELSLSDGTKVFLNAGSRLAYPTVFSGDSREVFLIGEAYFEVEHDTDQPFLVRVKDLLVKDLGTKFNVSAYDHDENIRTTLIEGKVAVKKTSASPFEKYKDLVPGQMYAYHKETQIDELLVVNATDQILWVSGIMKFESEKLGTVLAKLERYYNIRFQLKEQQFKSIRISGKLRLKEDVNEIVRIVAKTASLEVEPLQGGQYILYKKK
ncbi:FecR family protein [Dyadobacter tibetensis]|uniref:FecR family protein n=1 Tax=Dyadobacter tibetensis TaxID=1211851 RepID=UPI00046EDAC0|nr:FecR domain-containing protein [Dyadobacter tibetensis]